MIYIIHFETPLHHARHYVGYCREGALEERLLRHRSGQGSRLMYAVELAGIDFVVALTHPGDRHFERRIKRAKNTPRFCPLCRHSTSIVKLSPPPLTESPQNPALRIDTRAPHRSDDTLVPASRAASSKAVARRL